MLRKIRIAVAVFSIVFLSLVFLDFTGVYAAGFAYLTKIQLVPAILSGSLLLLGLWLVVTLFCGRVYCSVICPLGIMQDILAHFAHWGKKPAYAYAPAYMWCRYIILGVYALGLGAGFSAVFSLLDPYAVYGRILSVFGHPLYVGGNNGLASIAAATDSYRFYAVSWHNPGWSVAIIAALSLGFVGYLAVKRGRLYCNTVCPVGSFLGIVGKLAFFRPYIDKSQCVNCGMCAKVCKSACLDYKEGRADMSRCVACMNCLEVCRFGAIKYGHPLLLSTEMMPNQVAPREENTGGIKVGENQEVVNTPTAEEAQAQTVPQEVSQAAAGESETVTRRNLISGLAALGTAGIALTQTAQAQSPQAQKAQHKHGGPRQEPSRGNYILPPGAQSFSNFHRHCVGCQQCVLACPNQVLTVKAAHLLTNPTLGLLNIDQPAMSFAKGYCRPECTQCSQICPTGAIKPLTVVEKTSWQIGRAVWQADLCRGCHACTWACPNGAITRIDNPDKTPPAPGRKRRKANIVVDTERCLGCGACENVCPVRPLTAIHVEGNLSHRRI